MKEIKEKQICYLNFILIGIYTVTICLFGCKKAVTVNEPINSITTTEAFGTVAQANSAMAGIYANISQGLTYGNGAITIYAGMTSDELISYFGSSSPSSYQFNTNSILSNNSNLTYFWSQPYFTIYQCNAAIGGLAGSTGVDDSTKSELIGESEFLRAFCYFYLTNIFGDVPLVLTTNYNITYLMKNTPQSQIYQQIENDLKDAQSRLRSDYSYTIAGGERIIPNKWAAMALLARVYLFTGDWADAAQQSNAVIGNSLAYSLVTNGLSNVFNANSKEAIWQLKQNNVTGAYNATWEGYYFVPDGFGDPPIYYLSNAIVNAFELSDQRLINWVGVDSVDNPGVYYYYPFKYTMGYSQATPAGPVTQYYMMLRLAEQYLIRAEAEANGANGGLPAAISDLNTIRNRAGLNGYTGPANNKDSVLAAIGHERQVELFAEWGHRWFDLKRWKTATTVLTADKGFTVNENDLLYPIPVTELIDDPNLIQNPGYQ